MFITCLSFMIISREKKSPPKNGQKWRRNFQTYCMIQEKAVPLHRQKGKTHPRPLP